MADAEMTEVRPRSKPTTLFGLNMFELQKNAIWQKMLKEGSVALIIKRTEAFVTKMKQKEAETGEPHLQNPLAQQLIEELKQTAAGNAPKEGMSAEMALQKFEEMLVEANGLERLEGIKLDDPSGVTDVRNLRLAAHEAEKVARKAEGGEHADDKSEEFTIGDLGFAFRADDAPRALFDDIVREQEQAEEAEAIRRRANDALPENVPDRDFLTIVRTEAERSESTVFDPKRRKIGWGVTDLQRSIRATVGIYPMTPGLGIAPPPEPPLATQASVRQLLEDLENAPKTEAS